MRCGTARSTIATSIIATTVYESMVAARRMIRGMRATPMVAKPSQSEKPNSWRGVGILPIDDAILLAMDGAVRTTQQIPTSKPMTLPKQNSPKADSVVTPAPDTHTTPRKPTSLNAAAGMMEAAGISRPRPRKMPVVSSEYTRLERPAMANRAASQESRSTPETIATTIEVVIVGQTAAREAERMMAPSSAGVHTAKCRAAPFGNPLAPMIVMVLYRLSIKASRP